ncbi:MAG: hypothetical protein ACRYG8_54100, partial [Janthinobacterium lividum]
MNGLRFDINGHTDVVGRLGYHVVLSMLLAQAVVDYQASRGVPRFRMQPQGFGPRSFWIATIRLSVARSARFRTIGG